MRMVECQIRVIVPVVSAVRTRTGLASQMASWKVNGAGSIHPETHSPTGMMTMLMMKGTVPESALLRGPLMKKSVKVGRKRCCSVSQTQVSFLALVIFYMYTCDGRGHMYSGVGGQNSVFTRCAPNDQKMSDSLLWRYIL